MHASKHATGSTGWTGFMLLALALAITIPCLEGRDASVMGWHTAWPFIWLTIGATATIPVAVYAPEAVRRWDWSIPATTLPALCATIAIWGVQQGVMSGLALATFAAMALSAEGMNQKWEREIILISMTGLFMLAGAAGMCAMLIAFGHFAACFFVSALAFACAYRLGKRISKP